MFVIKKINSENDIYLKSFKKEKKKDKTIMRTEQTKNIQDAKIFPSWKEAEKERHSASLVGKWNVEEAFKEAIKKIKEIT